MSLSTPRAFITSRVTRVTARVLMALSIPVFFSASCSKTSAPPTTVTTLDETIAARVGQQAITLQTVERIAGSRGLPLQAALDLAVEDAVLAEHARSALAPYAPASHLERVALARSVFEQLAEEARARGPATQDELAEAIESHWWEVDRPETFRTMQAVVIADEAAPPQDHERAQKLAEAIRTAVLGATVDDFNKRARAVDKGSFKVTLEDLSPVAADGRVVDLRHPPKRGEGTAKYDATFAAAAAALKDIGEISPVVKTKFGYHVIMLTERVPPERAPQQQLEAEALELRARKATTELVTSLRSGASIVIPEQATALTGLIQVAQ